MIWKQHPTEEELLAHCEGVAAEAGPFDAHLRSCPACRARAEEISAGVATMRSLPETRLPGGSSIRILDAVRAAEARPHAATAGLHRRWMPAAVLAVLVLTVLLVFWRSRSGVIELSRENGAPSSLEQAASQYHALRADGALNYDALLSSPAEIRRWAREEVGVSAAVALNRPPEDHDRFRLTGVKSVTVNGASAALVAFEIDSHPVTLVTMSSSSAADPPRAALFSKHVYYRKRGATRWLTWNTSGQVYTLVSELPGYGQESCFLCHTAPEFRDRIRAMALR